MALSADFSSINRISCSISSCLHSNLVMSHNFHIWFTLFIMPFKSFPHLIYFYILIKWISTYDFTYFPYQFPKLILTTCNIILPNLSMTISLTKAMQLDVETIWHSWSFREVVYKSFYRSSNTGETLLKQLKTFKEAVKLYRHSSALETIVQKQKSSIAVEAGSVGKSRISLFNQSLTSKRIKQILVRCIVLKGKQQIKICSNELQFSNWEH